MTAGRPTGSHVAPTHSTKASRVRAKLDLLAIAAKTNTAVWRNDSSTQEERQDSLSQLVYAAKKYSDAESGRDRAHVEASLVKADTRPTSAAAANDTGAGRGR